LTNDDIFGGVGESLTVGLNWHWNPNARMQFNFLYGNIDDREDENGGLTSTDYSIFGTRFMVDF
jgi:phosphate-selective porin OprO/OprP